ncbi:Ppx/GppA family phosphatase [Glutamicibacter sp. MNS18]|uniref:Ppx/GppA phosphatase family protein n=1 Tax=Glutamicibacter sp. MNS18 TaxID=2989817 RepID=UPI002235A8AC|nr:Ppx/GppA phosphatase family protein [Glutamicibacter sp. MNS18]MCW4465068.1 Ppx/GppA family phosphatase [Glutamicibacter sp. MNS18]
MRVGAIDCGTNSIRLLIAEVEPNGQGVQLRDVQRQMRIVRLGQGVDATGRFAQEALERTYAAVRDYAQLLAGNQVAATRFVATSATRDAENREEFLDTVTGLLGVRPEVISGQEEAQLSFAGATGVLQAHPGTERLVIDLGGGSTEFVIGAGNTPRAAISIDMGCVRVTERFFTSGAPDAAMLQRAADFIDGQLQQLDELDFSALHDVVGVAGTITTLTAQALELSSYESAAIHAAELDFSKLRRACTQIIDMDRAQRAALGFMHPGRVDVIAAGALIVERITHYLQRVTEHRVNRLIASEQDILDGIALSVAAGQRA